MLGEYVADRWIVRMLREQAEQRGIAFLSWSDDWLIELQKADSIHRVIGYRFDLNDSVAAAISQDKVATYTVLTNNSIPAVPHQLVRTKVSSANREVMKGWKDIVIKPLDGTSGHGVKLFHDTDEAIRAIESSTIQAWAAAPFVDIQREVRIIVLDGTPLLAYEKRPVTINGLKMFNLGLGAMPVTIAASGVLIDLARRAQTALGLRLSAIDICETADGRLQILEVNDAIMMEHYARASAENKNRAGTIYGTILATMFE
jgi:glutathione synthase/RimK-type ligase-like ATP-grasp enzyme